MKQPYIVSLTTEPLLLKFAVYAENRDEAFDLALESNWRGGLEPFLEEHKVWAFNEEELGEEQFWEEWEDEVLLYLDNEEK